MGSTITLWVEQSVPISCRSEDSPCAIFLGPGGQEQVPAKPTAAALQTILGQKAAAAINNQAVPAQVLG